MGRCSVCYKYAVFAPAGTKGGLRCSKHKDKNDINVVSVRCIHVGCTKHAIFGLADSPKRLYCTSHRPIDMNGKHKSVRHYNMCKYVGANNLNCEKHAKYGPVVAGHISKPVYCRKHRPNVDDYLHVRYNHKCLDERCNKHASYGILGTRNELYCATHKDDTHVLIKSELNVTHIKNIKIDNEISKFINWDYCKPSTTIPLAVAACDMHKNVKY